MPNAAVGTNLPAGLLKRLTPGRTQLDALKLRLCALEALIQKLILDEAGNPIRK